jgi:hypothetical protein
MDTTTMNSTFYVDHSQKPRLFTRQDSKAIRTRRKLIERFPPLPFGSQVKAVEFSTSRKNQLRPLTSAVEEDSFASISCWAGEARSPKSRPFNRKRDFISKWEGQVLSSGTVRPF